MILFEDDDCPECGAEEAIIKDYTSDVYRCIICGQEWDAETGVKLN